MTATKLDHLRAILRSYGSCLVAYSGGVDSAFLAKVAHDVLGEKSLAVIADSYSLPRRELEEALELARQYGFAVRVIQTREFENPDYLSNPANRCFFCKHELFTELEPIARAEGFAVIAYGENASDVGDLRPGASAAAKFQVRAPLKEADLSKAEIRECSASLGLPTAEKPQMACLSSRIPHGEPVTLEKLRMIEQAENVLRDLGFHDVRVRHHELRSGPPGNWNLGRPDTQNAPTPNRPMVEAVRNLARIEVGLEEMASMFKGDISSRIVEALTQIGYRHVTLDLRGYRRGSLNENPAMGAPSEAASAEWNSAEFLSAAKREG
jgi:pyridinium-3,5-biscarboxylic acid mononucleotide sulfurtransferase